MDYKNLTKEESRLDRVLENFEKVTRKEFSSWSSNQRLSFLINAYNAFTLKLIVKRYPVKTIKEIGIWFFGKPVHSPWEKKFFSLFGEETNLDTIEHGVIRKDYSEPRIHFALVCASVGCPKLQSTPFIPTMIEEQLGKAARVFLGDSEKNKFNPEKNQMQLSQIFEWYGEDFGSDKKAQIKTILDLGGRSKNWEHNNLDQVDISYLEYDWRLNDKKIKR